MAVNDKEQKACFDKKDQTRFFVYDNVK